MTDHETAREIRAEELLAQKLQSLLGEIDAYAQERSDAAVRAARLKLAAVYGAKRLQRKIDEIHARAA